MPRSASTAIYKMARILTRENGAWVKDYDSSKKTKYHVIRVHDFDDQLANEADFVFTPSLAISEIIASLDRMGWPTEYVEESLIRQREEWRPHSTWEFPYADIVERTEYVMRGIATTLQVEFTKELLEEFLAIKEPIEDMDSVTLMHAGHRATSLMPKLSQR